MLNEIEETLYQTNEYGVRHQRPGAKLTPAQRDYMKEKYNINTDWHDTCISCQSRHLIKYAGKTDDDGNVINSFNVQCSGIPATLPPGSANKVNEIIAQTGVDKARALKIVQGSIDPVAWAELMFGFDDAREGRRLREYQKEQIRCTSNKVVLREGRRSGKTFAAAVKILYQVFNAKVLAGYDQLGQKIYSGPPVMIVTPFLSQLLNVFNEMESLLKINKDLSSTVTTGGSGSLYVKTPFFRMEFSNGAVIKGFVSGSTNKQDDSGGGTLRGQSASFIYIDEMDMIPESILEKVILPILLSDELGGFTLWATSTPIGKKGSFYSWCKEDDTFKEDHLPSTVLPQWEKIKKTYEPPKYTKEAFESEFLALFTDGEYGVFKPSLIRMARRNYSYHQVANKLALKNIFGVIDPSKLSIVLGIDWNKNAGSEFVVVAYDPSTGLYITLDAINIGASEFSANKWKQVVIDLNAKWSPDYIYADEGYGHHIIEDLKLLSFQLKASAKTHKEKETALLYERLVSFNFSQKIELVSPIDGEIMSKTGKDYLIQNAVRIFEDQVICIPEDDEALYQQLHHYVVLRRSPVTNKPIYGSDSDKIGDHRLDAFMLALAGLQLEFGQFSNKQALAASEVEQYTRKELQDQKSSPGALNILRGTMKQDEFLMKYKPSENEPIDKIAPRAKGTRGKTNLWDKLVAQARNHLGMGEDDFDLTKHSQGDFIERKRSSRRSLFK